MNNAIQHAERRLRLAAILDRKPAATPRMLRLQAHHDVVEDFDRRLHAERLRRGWMLSGFQGS